MANKFSRSSKNYHFLFIILIFPLINFSFAANSEAITETQNKLKQLTNRINKLKQNLTNASDKKSILNQELAKTEKKIDLNLQKLQLTQQELAVKQQKINGLAQQINEINQLLHYQQNLLAEHIKIRYKTGEYQPLKWIINQNDFLAISRLLTYHQYLAYSRRQIIDKINVTKTNLAHNQAKLKIEIETKRALQRQLASFQEKLKRNKEYQSFVIQTLNNDIQTKEQSLLEYERNKENLTKLLTSLNEQTTSFTQSLKPFIYMRHKLQLPVHIDKNNYQKMNQGITFFANEGVPVYAIYSGKVVFSDWLNGYGLLLIIDHGQGFMSLYAHNQALYKKQGAIVQLGEQIAAVGHTGGVKQNGLYFEIRQRGKAVPPLGWLS
ncbi:murein hydrolase activator EnvC family protein [Legionella sp. CNM-1927-20]|uniref:murein hydrolase activator EnvC family protein n=1 Tax=Legionella sp. CNM-1927-20 TaxID=3422221 RepID=UPI00403AC56F